MRTCWKCNAKTSAKIIASIQEWNEKVKEANKLAKSIGATAAYFGRAFGSPQLEGFAFAENPKGFSKLRGTTNGYKPRMGSELEKQMREFRCDAINLAMELTGIEMFSGHYINSVGIVIWKNTAYLETQGSPTKGCKRISDLEFEKVKNLSATKQRTVT